MVDFAAMRDAVERLGGDPQKINPVCPADLVIDHSVQVDVARRCVFLALSMYGMMFRCMYSESNCLQTLNWLSTQ